MSGRVALVTGGSGALGSEVVRKLTDAGARVVFTFLRSRERAEVIAKETGATAVPVDLTDRAATRAFVAALARDGVAPDVFVHCAGISGPTTIAATDDAAFDAMLGVSVRAAWVLAQSLAPGMARAKRGDVVLVGALDRGQSVSMPVHFAAANGALAAMAMALAKELGSTGIRANFVALGPLEGGISRDLPPKLLADYRAFSALRRTATPAEIAPFLAWLALENTFVSGKSIPLNGGL